MRILEKSLLAAVLAIIMLAPARANLIVNGSFEDPDIGTNTFGIFGAIPGWTTTFGPGIEIQDQASGPAFDGTQYVELDSNGNSGMEQLVATTAGATYLLKYAYSPRPGVGQLSNEIQVFWDGTLVAAHVLPGLNTTDWTEFSWLLSATGAVGTLEFRAAGIEDTVGGLIDGVSLVLADGAAAPEPGTLALFAAGLLGVASAIRRRRLRCA